MSGTPDYHAGLRDGREQGAKHMRASIEAYLASCGVEHPPLPRTLGERREFEREWDARFARGSDAPRPAKPEGDDPRAGRLMHNHPTRDIKKKGKCPACDEYHERRESE